MPSDSKKNLTTIGLILTLFLAGAGPSYAEQNQDEMKQKLLGLASVVVNNCKKARDQVLASPPPAALWDLKVGASPCKNDPNTCDALMKLTQAYSYASFQEDKDAYYKAEAKRDQIISQHKGVQFTSSKQNINLSDQIASLHKECFGHVKRMAENLYPMMQHYSEIIKKGSTLKN